MAPANDPQRDALYQLEAEFDGVWCYASSSRAQLLKLLNTTCRYYKLPAPSLRIVNRPNGYMAWVLENQITLNRAKGGNTAGVLLHELAHYVVDSYYENVEDHGQQFCAIYMHLLQKFHFFPMRMFRRIADEKGIKVGRSYLPKSLR